jgi:RNA polymerase sigma-70 factor (ECF subfamily)
MLHVRNGDVGKLATLFERHHRALYNFFWHSTGNREISEDLVQEVFLRILKYRHTYRGESQFTVWMYRIARNASADYFRKSKREVPLHDLAENELMSHDPIASDKLEQRQEIILLRTALAKLPLEKREVLVLSRFQNLKYEEIAELLGCTVGTVKARIHRAIKDLRKFFLSFREINFIHGYNR